MTDPAAVVHSALEENLAVLYRTARYVLADAHEAEDAVQDAALDALRAAGRYDPSRPVGPWLTGIAYRSALARKRRKGTAMRARTSPGSSAPQPEPPVADAAEHDETLSALRALVADLEVEERTTVALHYYEGLSLREIGQVQGVPHSTVQDRLKTALGRLRRGLAGAGMLAAAPAALDASLRAMPRYSVPSGLADKVRALTQGKAALAAPKGGVAMKLVAGVVLAGALAAGAALTMSAAPEPIKPLPPPPFEVLNAKDWPGWIAEHIAFTYGHTGKPVGGPARWAVGGAVPGACYPADQAGRLYVGEKNSDARIYFSDQCRRVWLLEKGEVWPIAGADDLGEEDGPGPYARFIYTGVYGGSHSGMVASGHTAYMADNGWLRRIRRGADGSWTVDTVAGKGGKNLAPGQAGQLSDLGRLGKGLAMDAKGNLYFTLGGGLAKADPEGSVSWIVTAEQATRDMAEVYARKWPGAKTPGVALGQGEGVDLHVQKDGSIYGGGRTWPSTWKVTAEGKFVPLINYAPKDKMLPGRWGPGDPACYEPHCCMGWGVTEDGYVWHQNEIPFARSRYEFDKNQVTVLDAGLIWKLQPPDYKGFFKLPDAVSINADCTLGELGAPGPLPGRSSWVRVRKTAEKGERP